MARADADRCCMLQLRCVFTCGTRVSRIMDERILDCQQRTSAEARVATREDKKVYTITAAGTRELEEHREEVASFYEQSEDVWEDRADELFELTHLVRRLMRSFRRSARRGRLTASTMTKARQILEDAVVKLEALLDS